MFSFLKSYLKWSFLVLIVFVGIPYFVEVIDAFQHGAGFLNSLLWFRVFPKELSLLKSSLSDFVIGYVVSASVSLGVFSWWINDLDKLDDLKGKIDDSLTEIERLKKEKEELKEEISALKKEKKSYQSEVDKLSQEVENLSNNKRELLSSISSLEERKENLASYLEEELQKGYEAGREQGYQSVITELRSLRFQKSALLRLFDSNKELKTFFKKVTGRTIRQYLNEVKKKVKSSGGGN
jgi:septal ring factor EnvC (AmiA/AmiB activator)